MLELKLGNIWWQSSSDIPIFFNLAILPLKLFQVGKVFCVCYTSRDKQNDKSCEILSSFLREEKKIDFLVCMSWWAHQRVLWILAVEPQRANWKVQLMIPNGDQDFAFGPYFSSRDTCLFKMSIPVRMLFFIRICRLPYRVLLVITNGFSTN